MEPNNNEELKDLSSFLNTTPTQETPIIPNIEAPKINEEPDENDSETLGEILDNTKRLGTRLIVTGTMFVISLYMSLCNIYSLYIPPFIDPWKKPSNYLIALLFCLVITIVSSLPVLANGFSGFFTGRANYDTPAAFCAFFVSAHTIFDIFTDGIKEYDGEIYVSVAILIFVANTFGKTIMLKRAKTNWEIVNKGENYTEKFLQDDHLINDLMEDQGFDFPVASIKCDAYKLNHLEDITYSPDYSEDICKYSFPILCAIGAVLAVCSTVLTKNSYAFGIDYFVAMVCVSCALTETLVANIPFWKVNKELNEEGSFIASYETIEAFEDVNAIVIEDRELYPKGSLKMHGMKTFSQTSANELIIDAASLMSESDGIMKDVLMSTINNNVSLLHSVSGIKVTNDGTSGKIGGSTILMGSRSYLLDNGIAMNQEAMDFESGYAHSGKSIMYLAENGELCAIFVVSYRPSRKIAMQINGLAKSDYTILLYSNDPNINPAKVASDYGYEERFIKQIDNTQREDTISRIAPVKDAPAFVAIGQNSKNRLRIINAISILHSNVKLGVMLQTVFMVIEFGIYVASLFLMPETAISFVHVLLFKILFSLITLIPGLTIKF